MRRCGLLVVLLVVSLCVASCSLSAGTPQKGEWYCEELSLSINFSIYQSQNTPDCATLYEEDGTQTDIRCYFDYGTGITITSQDQEITYLVGQFKYSGNELTVTSNTDGTVYVFTEISE